MSWRRKEPEHQEPWYLLCWTELIRSLHYFKPEATQAARWRAPQFQAVCMGYTANTMSANGLVTLEARASAVISLNPKARVFLLQHQKS